MAEVDAIARLAGRPFAKTFFLNFYYEYSTMGACTGVVMHNDEGKIIHGRNLDFGFEDKLANMAVTI